MEITSSWIDEAGEGETADFGSLWVRIFAEITSADALLLYAETDDFPLKGAIVEVGAAIAMGKPVFAILPGVHLEERTLRPVGSWMAHPLVTRCDAITEVQFLLHSKKQKERQARVGR